MVVRLRWCIGLFQTADVLSMYYGCVINVLLEIVDSLFPISSTSWDPANQAKALWGVLSFFVNNFPFDLLPFYHRKTVVCNNLRAVLFHHMPLLLSFFLGILLWKLFSSAWLHERNNVVYLDKEGLIYLSMSKKLVNSPLFNFNLENNMSRCWEKMAELHSEKSRLCHHAYQESRHIFQTLTNWALK